MLYSKKIIIFFILFLVSQSFSQTQYNNHSYKIYPEVNDKKPDLPSPYINKNGDEFVIAITKEKKYAVVPVTLSNDRKICKQLIIDSLDFPMLAKTGLHSEDHLDQITSITNRPLQEITKLGRPGGLSFSGFMAKDEDIISVIKGDNHIVKRLGQTHPQMAKPLFHILNMMDTDLALNRWNMAKHQWDNITSFLYNDNKIFVEAGDTKGGQLSIFDDGIQGAFHITIWREFNPDEMNYLKENYGNLPKDEFDTLKTLLSRIFTGEMEPQYIMRYGFYEGHTEWRTDPVSIAFIFGFMSIEELDKRFNNKLNRILIDHF